jgi:hypothetical protein
MKLGYGGRIWNTKDKELQKGSKAREQRKESTVELSINKFF